MCGKSLTLAVVLAALLPLAACGIDVREDQRGDQTEVDISTPLGDMVVRTNGETPATGLPVYPGAQPLRDDEPESANVAIGSPFFGVNVAVARFASDAAPTAILEYYKNEMKAYGEVTECQGNIDFRRRGGAQVPVCRERGRSRERQLVVGTEERHRIVSVKPRGGGSEFAVVSIETRSRG